MRHSFNEMPVLAIGLFLAGLPFSALADMRADQFVEARDASGKLLIDETGETWGASWGDLNGDGFPDLWLANHQYTPTVLLQNLGGDDFADVADRVIVDPQSHVRDDTHGVSWADFDNDGDDDLVEACGGAAGEAAIAEGINEEDRNNLFVNEDGILTEQGKAYGVGYPRARGRTPAWVDFDNDGLLDLVITAQKTASGQYPSVVFRQGFETFSDVSAMVGFDAGSCENAMLSHLASDDAPNLVCADSSRISAIYDITAQPFSDLRSRIGGDLYEAYPFDLAIADFNGDLLPDVFGVVAPPITTAAIRSMTGDRIHATLHFSPEHDAVPSGQVENGFSFTAPGDVRLIFGWETERDDVSLGAGAIAPPECADPGLVPPYNWPHRLALTLSSSDPSLLGLPANRDQGIYVGYEAGRWNVRAVNIDHRLHIVAIAPGISEPEAFGPMELTQGSRLPPILFLNEGGRLRRTATAESFVDAEADISLYGRSVVAGDFDNDMDVDVYVGATGTVANVPNRLFENLGSGTFRLVEAAGGASGHLLGKTDTVTSVDFDLDGCLDLFVTQGAYPAPFSYFGSHQLFRNRCSGRHWIEVDLSGVVSNANGIGAQVYAYTPDGRAQLREQSNGAHKYAQDFRRIHFGLGVNQRVDLEVRWPSGVVDRFDGLSVDRVVQLTEGASAKVPEHSLTVADVLTSEDADAKAAVFDIALSPAPGPGEVVQVAYRAIGETAVEGQDFVATAGVLRFGQGERQQRVQVPLLNDDAQEDTEALALELGSPATGVVTRRATIMDDDAGKGMACGAPAYSPIADRAVLLWNECGTRQWHLRLSGGGSERYRHHVGSLSSDLPFPMVSPYSVEANDLLDTSKPGRVVFDFVVGGVYEDGLDFALAQEGRGCFRFDSSSELPVLIGARRAPIGSGGVDLCTP